MLKKINVEVFDITVPKERLIDSKLKVSEFSENIDEYDAILLLNNDYEGGELEFKEMNEKNNDEIVKIENKPGRVIIWPSNFMYRHRVTPITKGTRYSVVCWYS